MTFNNKVSMFILGSNPSAASKNSSAFCTSTKSGKTLHDWLSKLNISHYALISNVAEYVTKDNKPLTAREIKEVLPKLKMTTDQYKNYKFIALGKTAAKALTLLHIPFYEMPHPSGLNRQLNNKKFVEEKLNGLRQYLQNKRKD